MEECGYRSLRKIRPAKCQDNIKWIKEAESNNLGGCSQARILYAMAEGED